MIDGNIQINNKNYFLSYSINVLCEMKADGIDVMKLNEDMDFIQIRALFYYGLKRMHSKEIKTLEAAGDLMSDFLENGGDMELLGETISKALTHSLGIKTVAEGK